jgi:hypothetical protein
MFALGTFSCDHRSVCCDIFVRFLLFFGDVGI